MRNENWCFGLRTKKNKRTIYSQCKELLTKLEGLSNRHFQSHVKHIRTMLETLLQNRQLFYTIEVLDEAISKGRKISFIYLSYGLDKQRHPRNGEEGRPKEHTASFRMKKYLIDDVFDWFGTEVCFFNEDRESVTARTRVNLQAVRRWDVQYGSHIRALSPESLIEVVKQNNQSTGKAYEQID